MHRLAVTIKSPVRQALDNRMPNGKLLGEGQSTVTGEGEIVECRDEIRKNGFVVDPFGALLRHEQSQEFSQFVLVPAGWVRVRKEYRLWGNETG